MKKFKYICCFLLLIAFNNSFSGNFDKPIKINKIGQTCYINAVLQCLFQIKPLINFTKDGLNKPELNGYYNNDSLADHFVKLVNYINNQDLSKKIDLPQAFYQAVFKSFNISQDSFNLQQDSSELLSKLLSSLDDTDICQGIKNKPEFINQLSQIFNISIKEKSNSEIKTNNFNKLDLPIIGKNNVKLNTCLDEYFAQNSQNPKKLINIPEYLILTLNRGLTDNRESEKDYTKVSFNLDDLELTKYLDEELKKQDKLEYELVSFIGHSGSLNKGHYIAYVKSENSIWYLCDDHDINTIPYVSLISKIGIDEWTYQSNQFVLDKKSYNELSFTPVIFIYKKKEIKQVDLTEIIKNLQNNSNKRKLDDSKSNQNNNSKKIKIGDFEFENDFDFDLFGVEPDNNLGEKFDQIEKSGILGTTNFMPNFNQNSNILHDLIDQNKDNIFIKIKIRENLNEVNSFDSLGYAPIHKAVIKGNFEIVDFLLNNGAQINIKHLMIGATPLHLAVFHKNTLLVKLLLSRGADVNSTDNELNTPLHQAYMLDNNNDILNLLNNFEGINRSLINEDGLTPIEILMNKVQKQQIQNNFNSNFNNDDKNNDFEVEKAIKEKNIEKVRQLLKIVKILDLERLINLSTDIQEAEAITELLLEYNDNK